MLTKLNKIKRNYRKLFWGIFGAENVEFMRLFSHIVNFDITAGGVNLKKIHIKLKYFEILRRNYQKDTCNQS